MRHFLKAFSKGEEGAVTVDWVVLSAAAAGLSLALIWSIRDAILAAGTEIIITLYRAALGSF